MREEYVDYKDGSMTCKGYVAYPKDRSAPRPCVLIAPAWKGQDDFAREKARQLAELGYIGFAADIYGDGKCVETNDEAAEMMMPYFIDRKMLRQRITAAYNAASANDSVDDKNIGAIGFCFGGLTVIELYRSGANLKGYVSFHGLLGAGLGDTQAKVAPAASKLHGSMLILHGNEDPLVSQEDVVNMKDELTKAGTDWQMHIYGHAMHAFTNAGANEPSMGLMFNPKAEQRSIRAMKNFFEEVFS